jgi:hypothetical protein
MSYSNIVSIRAKTSGFHRYTPTTDVWLVTIDARVGRPFVTATVENGPDNDGYYDLSMKRQEGCSYNVPRDTQFLGELVRLDGLSRDDERVLMGVVNDVRMLHASISTVHSAPFGKDAFQFYPPTSIELDTFRQSNTFEDTLLDGQVRTLDLIVRCNRRTELRETTALGTRYDAKILEYPLKVYSLEPVESIVLRWRQNHGIDLTSVFLKTDIQEVEGRPPYRTDVRPGTWSSGHGADEDDKDTVYLRIVKRTTPRDSTLDVPWKDDAKLQEALVRRNAYLRELEETALESGLVQLDRDERDIVERIILAKRRAGLYETDPCDDIPKEIGYRKRGAVTSQMIYEYNAMKAYEMSDVSSGAATGEAQDQSSTGTNDDEPDPNVAYGNDAITSATVQIDHGEDAKPKSKNRANRRTGRTSQPTPDDDDTSTTEAKKRKRRRKS